MITSPLSAGSHSLSVIAGVEYLITIPGDLEGATVSLEYSNGDGTFYAVKEASWTEAVEARFVAPSNTMRLVVSGGGPVNVFITQVK